MQFIYILYIFYCCRFAVAIEKEDDGNDDDDDEENDDDNVVVPSSLEEEMDDKMHTQKKEMKATKATRKCSGTTPKVRHWTGIQMDQYLFNKPRSLMSAAYLSMARRNVVVVDDDDDSSSSAGNDSNNDDELPPVLLSLASLTSTPSTPLFLILIILILFFLWSILLLFVVGVAVADVAAVVVPADDDDDDATNPLTTYATGRHKKGPMIIMSRPTCSATDSKTLSTLWNHSGNNLVYMNSCTIPW